MISAYIATLGFGSFYYYAGATWIAYDGFIAFSLFVIYSATSFFTKSLLILFRLSIATALVAFFIQTLFTGGVKSIVMAEFIIPPLLAFFYRPIKDRYVFMILSALCIISMWPLTEYGIAKDMLPDQYETSHGFIVTAFVFSIVAIYTFLFRYTLAKKNRKLSESIDELRNTTQKLIEAEKMASLGVMSAGVAHEINNPLNFIKGGISMLSKKVAHDKNTQPFINAINEGVDRASLIVNSLGHFSRESAAMDEECDIHEIVDNCLVMLQHKLKYKVTVVKDYSSAKFVTVKGNEGKLHQAILNIISNAEQAIPEKGKITIQTRAKAKHLRLTISDNGVGIPENYISKISDPFFTTKPAGEGTGLGLSITYGIIKDHDASISVTSEPNNGTNFNIIFKLSE